MEAWAPAERGCAVEGQAVRFVLCVRNPYAWLVSCFRYFRKAVGRDPSLPAQFRDDPSQTFEQFLKQACYEFQCPVDRWIGCTWRWRRNAW